MLRVVTYHRIANPGDDPHLDPGLISATPSAFAVQMEHLRRSYDVVSAKDVLDGLGSRIRLPRRAVMLTFDDAYIDFDTNAWPILKRLGLPATLFVPTAYADDASKSFWWDRLYRAAQSLDLTRTVWKTLKCLRTHVKALPHHEALSLVDRLVAESGVQEPGLPTVIDWEGLRRLAAAGVTIAAHTRTHPILSRVSTDEISNEILGSQEDLKRSIGITLPVFCYPGGAVDDRVVRLLADNNFVLGFTTQLGHNNLRRSNSLLLCRTDITMRTSLPIFKLRLHSVGNYIDRWRQS